MHFLATESSCGEVANPEQENLIQKVLDMTAIPDIWTICKSQGVSIVYITEVNKE